MTPAEINLLWFLLGTCLAFAILIYSLLRLRKRGMERNLLLQAQEIWSPLRDSRWNFANLLFGVLQDFSATEIGLIVRDSRDQDVGKISFRTGARKGWITIQTNTETFEADVLPTLSQSIVLHAAGNASDIICTFRRLRGAILSFDVKGIGVLESKITNRFQMTPWFEYRLNGQPIGGSQRIGRWIDRGCLVVFPSEIPLLIRLFILAVQKQRS